MFETMAAQGWIAVAEAAVSRLLAGIEVGDAIGYAAQAFKRTLRRHGATILQFRVAQKRLRPPRTV